MILKEILTNVGAMFCLLIFGAIIFAASAFALPGDTDPTFKTGGFVVSNFGGSAYASVLQSDGKLVFVSSASASNGGVDFATTRYNSDGTLRSGQRAES